MQAQYFWFIDELLYNRPDTFIIRSRIREVTRAENPNDTDDITVAASHSDIDAAVRAMSVAPQGVVKPIAIAARVALAGLIAAGISAEGPGEEAVLDENGDPVTRPTSISDPTPIAVTQPKPWMRVYNSLTAIEDGELACRNQMIARGKARATMV